MGWGTWAWKTGVKAGDILVAMQNKNVADMEKEDQVAHLKEIRPLQLTFARDISAVEDPSGACEKTEHVLPACVRSAPPVVAAARASPSCFTANEEAEECFPRPDNSNVYDNDAPLDPLYLIPRQGLREVPDDLASAAAQAASAFGSLLSWTAPLGWEEQVEEAANEFGTNTCSADLGDHLGISDLDEDPHWIHRIGTQLDCLPAGPTRVAPGDICDFLSVEDESNAIALCDDQG